MDNTGTTFIGVNPNCVLGGSFDMADPLTGLLSTHLTRHLYSRGAATPTFTGLPALGLLAPVPVTTDCDDIRGTFTFGTGGPIIHNGQYFQITYAAPYTTTPKVNVTPSGPPNGSGFYSAPLLPYSFNESTVGFWVGLVNAPAASQPNTTYGITYEVIG